VSSPDRTYWDIVRSQYRKNPIAMAGLWLVTLLFALAVLAPVLAQSSPYYMSSKAHGVESPWLRDLFNQNRFPSGVDLFFNLLLVVLPVFLVLAIFVAQRKTLAKTFVVVFAYLFFCIVGPEAWIKSPVGDVLFAPHHVLRRKVPKRDYLKERWLTLDYVLATQRIQALEPKLEDATASLAEAEQATTRPDLDADSRFDAEVRLTAARDAKDKAARQLDHWRGVLADIEEKRKDPDLEVFAVVPPIGYHHDDNQIERIVERPTFTGWGIGHFLGTDRNGRDVLARILYGTRVSLTIGVIAVAIYCTIGAILGSLMGYFGGWVDIFGMRLVEIMICFPVFIFILIVVAVFDTKSIFIIMVAIGLVSWTGVARLIRGQMLVERGQDYVFAARALGVPNRRIVFKHVLPNAIHPLFVSATFGVAAAILLESGLAFLGLGDPNVPSWGQILKEGRETSESWLILSPGFAIFLTVTTLNLVGEGLRDALDPKLRQ